MEYMGEDYFKLKATVIKYERFLLKELGFCVHVKHPHKLIITYLQMLELEKNTSLAQRSWNYMNDSLRTNVFVRFSPETIACSCIYLGARQLKIPLPQSPAWWLLFDADFEDMEAVSLELLALYRKPRPLLEKVEKELMKLKEEYQKRQVEIKEVKLKKTEPMDQSKKGLLPTPEISTVAVDNDHSSQGSPLPSASLKLPVNKPAPSSPTSVLLPATRPRTIPKSYKVSPTRPLSPPYPTSLGSRGELRLPSSGSRATRSVSPLVTHVHSASHDPATPPPKPVPSPIHWQQSGSGPSEDSDSDSGGTPSPIIRCHTPGAYCPVMSPIIVSEEGSDSTLAPPRSPSPLSLVRRENGLQERTRDEVHDRKIRKSRHKRSDRGNHRSRGERRVRSRSNETSDRHDHHRRKHHHKERHNRDKYVYEKRRLHDREYAYDQRSRKVDHHVRR